MKFDVQVPTPVKEKVAKWGLPTEAAVAFYLQLNDDLATIPESELRRIAAPVRFVQHRFTLEHGGVTRLFVVRFNDWTKEGTRIVLSCDCLS